MNTIEDLTQNNGGEERVPIAPPRQQRHRIIMPNYNSEQEKISDSVKASDREVIDIAKLTPKEESEDIRESYVKDLVDPDNPNSLLSKYIDEKQKEASEYLAQLDQQENLEEAEVEEEENNFQQNNNAEKAELGFESSFNTETSIPVQTSGNIEVMDENIEQLKEVEVIHTNPPVYDKPINNLMVEEKRVSTIKKEEVENPDIDPEVDVIENKQEVEYQDDTEDSGNVVDDDEMLEHLQKLATEKIKPVANSLNLSSFTIVKKPTANIKGLENTNIKAAKWVLPIQESIVLMKEFLGSELENIREASEDTANVSQMFRKFRSIYDHIVSAKPATYEAWLKSTPFADADHYFFAAYIASFKGVNYLPLDCENPKCAKTLLTDDMPILDLVKFPNEESKKKFTEIYSSEGNYAGKGLYVSEIVALSNNLAIGFKDASIYNLFEIYSLSQADREKYKSIIDIMPYIDSLYIINAETKELIPIGYKIYPDNPTKTIKSKINVFYNAMKSLTVDEFTPIRSFVRNITNRKFDFGYRYPAVKCPHCGTMTKEIDSTAEQLLFVRYQLGALANTSLK